MKNMETEMAVKSWSDIYALTDDCMAAVLSLTSPKDACRISAVASTFRSDSLSDAVWSRFLPSDYCHIISRTTDGGDSLLTEFQSKKDLYFYLCDNPILIDEGRKSFWLEKSSGKKCYMLGPRALTIVGGSTKYRKSRINLPEFRFREVAELVDVSSFSAGGIINTKMLSWGCNYAAYLVFTCKSRSCEFEKQIVQGCVGIGRDWEKRYLSLDPQGNENQIVPRIVGLFNKRMSKDGVGKQHVEYTKQRMDGWMEVELGEYFVNQDGKCLMLISEISNDNWKSGIVIQGIEIRPK